MLSSLLMTCVVLGSSKEVTPPVPPSVGALVLRGPYRKEAALGPIPLSKDGASLSVSVPAIRARRLYAEVRVYGAPRGRLGPSVRISVLSKDGRLLASGEDDCFESRLHEVKPGETCTVQATLPASPNQADEFVVVIKRLDDAATTVSVAAIAFDPME